MLVRAVRACVCQRIAREYQRSSIIAATLPTTTTTTTKTTTMKTTTMPATAASLGATIIYIILRTRFVVVVVRRVKKGKTAAAAAAGALIRCLLLEPSTVVEAAHAFDASIAHIFCSSMMLGVCDAHVCTSFFLFVVFHRRSFCRVRVVLLCSRLSAPPMHRSFLYGLVAAVTMVVVVHIFACARFA